MTQGSWNMWKDKIAWGLVAGGLSALLAWSAWTTLEVLTHPDRDEVIRMIESYSPYAEDRKLIGEAMADTKETNKELKTAIDLNTKILIRLETVMETRRQ